MPFEGFQCQRCGECCRKLGATTLCLSKEQLRHFEARGVGSNLDALRTDSRLDRYGDGVDSFYEVLDKQTALDVAGVEVTLETEGSHCAFFTLDENGVAACGMELDYGIKPETCRDFPLDPEHGVKFSNCAGCRTVLGSMRSDELRRGATGETEPSQ